MASIDLSSLNTGQEQQEEVLFGYFRIHKMLQERYPELALKGLKQTMAYRYPIHTGLLPSEITGIENQQGKAINDFIEANRERLYREDLSEKYLKELGIYDLLY